MELLNFLIGVGVLAVAYTIVDNIAIKNAVRKQQAGLNEMWVAMTALKEYTMNSVNELGVDLAGERMAVDVLVDALERFDERLAQLEPKVEDNA